jgi:hypothetical protein
MFDGKPFQIIICPSCQRRAAIEEIDGKMYYVHNLAGTDPKSGVTSFHFVHCPFKESTAQHRQKKYLSR